MRHVLSLAALVLCLAGSAAAGELDPRLLSFFREWSVPLANPAHVVICHGFGCTYHTEIGLGPADHARMREFMAAGSASAAAERSAIAKTEAWFEKRIAPEAGTSKRVARAGALLWKSHDPGQFDCLDTTLNTNSLLIILERLSLLRHHVIAPPISRFLIWEGPHNTAVIRDRRANEDWAVDPWTHQGSELPDVWTVAKWSAGG